MPVHAASDPNPERAGADNPATDDPSRGVWTIIVGGGSGARFGRMKQYEELASGERVIDRSRRVAESATSGVVLVVPADDAVAEGGVAGGTTRSDSVRAGLDALPADAEVEIVCVHDAARPLADPAVYERVIGAVRRGADGAVPGVPVADTVKIVDAEGRVVDTPDRATLRAVQTPQAFRVDVLRRAHDRGGEATDDAGLVEAVGGRVVVVDGDVDNRKITVPADLAWAREWVASREGRS